MLTLSLLTCLLSVITTFLHKLLHPSHTHHLSTTYSPALLHLPEKLGSFYHCISVYMCFYCQFHHLLPSLVIHHPTFHRPKKQSYSRLPLFLLLYTCINLHICSAVYFETAPITTLGIIPTCIGASLLTINLPKRIQNLPNLSTKLAPSQATLMTSEDKLAYLSAWTLLHDSQKLHLMNFSPGGQPICIDTGASCCISNNRNDFITFQPSSNRALSGIANGLQIEGTGTVCWCILNDNGDEVQLHIHNSLYVPSLPINLLSPQQICQQTKHLDDGFVIGASHDTLRFANHQRTIHYNPTNNLPILFTFSS
jgi:hypothetical protein